jgi:molecular chaperone GrpE
MTDPKKTESNSDDGIEYIEDDDFSGEKSSKDKIKKLREKLAKCEDEKKQNLAGWQRSKADLINYKKEVEEQKTAYVKIGQESVISELMTVVDAFYSAMKNQTAWESVDSN